MQTVTFNPYNMHTSRYKMEYPHIIFLISYVVDTAGLSGLVGCAFQLVIRRLRVRPPPGRQHSFVKIDYEIFSMVILSLPLIQEGQLSVSGKRMCTILVNPLED